MLGCGKGVVRSNMLQPRWHCLRTCDVEGCTDCIGLDTVVCFALPGIQPSQSGDERPQAIFYDLLRENLYYINAEISIETLQLMPRYKTHRRQSCRCIQTSSLCIRCTPARR